MIPRTKIDVVINSKRTRENRNELRKFMRQVGIAWMTNIAAVSLIFDLAVCIVNPPLEP